MIKAKITPRRSAGSKIILIIDYSSSREILSTRLTMIRAAVIGRITPIVPQKILARRFAKDGVIMNRKRKNLYFEIGLIRYYTRFFEKIQREF
jgi:hypothetical protein